jgi:5,10-methylenetetrahydromethanopterin reductase
LGAGHSGFRELYLERTHPGQAIRETVQIVKGLLAGERVTLDGKMIKVRDAKLNFTPRGQVPIIVASNGQYVIRVAGEVADGVMSSSVLVQPRIDEVLELVEKGLQISGRKRSDITVWSRLNIITHPDRKKALRAPKPSVYGLITGRYPDMGMFERMGLFLPDDLRHTVETVAYTRDPEKLSWIVDQIPDEFVEKTCLVGSPSEIVEQLKNLEAAGFDGAVLYPVPVEGQSLFDVIKVVTEEVIPAAS